MHAKSGLRVVLKWKIYRPDSVIAAVIPLECPTAGKGKMANPTEFDLLISVVGYGESWQGAASETPWSVFVTRSGTPVLNGGLYPDGNSDARLVIGNLTMDAALLVAKRLSEIFAEMGVSCIIEELADL